MEFIQIDFLPDWFLTILEWTIGFIVRFLAIGFLFSIFRYIILLILSPALAYVAQCTEQIQSKKNLPFSFRQFSKDLVRAFYLTINNSIKQLLLIVLFTILSFIPVIGWFCPIILILIEAYFLGFSLLDYTLEQKQYTIKATQLFIRQNKTLAISLGLFFYSLLLIPIFGWMFGPIICVIAGNIAIHKKLQHGTR